MSMEIPNRYDHLIDYRQNTIDDNLFHNDKSSLWDGRIGR